MSSTNLNFEKFTQDAYEYMNELSANLGHPDEQNRVLIIWRAVLHSIRDRITLGESFQLFAPLPMIFKGVYVEGWQYSTKPSKNFDSIKEFKNEVKALQSQYGEAEFSWSKSTEEIISITINSLDRYLEDEQLEHIKGQMPVEIKDIV